MTKEQEEAIEMFKELEMCDDKEFVNARETILSMLEEKEKELQMLEEFKEIANSKVTELNPIRISKGKSIDK